MWASLTLIGCAHVDAGWKLEGSRTCPAAEQMRVCVRSNPDRGVVARVGDAELVPGECASREGPEGRGRVSLIVEEEDGGETRERARVRAGRVTTLTLAPSGTESSSRACSTGEFISSETD